MKTLLQRYSPLLDRLGFSASTLCAIHCVAMPFLLGVLPALGLGFLADTLFEVSMIGLSVTIGVISLGRSYRIHRIGYPFVIMMTGAIVLMVNLATHEMHSEFIEILHPYIAGFGGLMIATGHLLNIRINSRLHARDHEHLHTEMSESVVLEESVPVVD